MTVNLFFGKLTGSEEVLNYIACALHEVHENDKKQGYVTEDDYSMHGNDADAIYDALASVGYYDHLRKLWYSRCSS